MSTLAQAAPASRISLRRVSAALGIAVLLLLVILGILHEVAAPYARGAAAGAALLPPDAAHIFGTDGLGHDVLSETIHALGVTAGNAILGFAVALGFGTLAGLVAAHLMGLLGSALRLAAGVIGAIPVILLAILLVMMVGGASAAVAAGLAAAPIQFVRSFDRTRMLLSRVQNDFARASGITSRALFKRDITHEFTGALVSLSARAFASVAITLATMSFFGFGANASIPDLGMLIASARPVLATAWWAAAFPAGMLVLLVLAAHVAAQFSRGERS